MAKATPFAVPPDRVTSPEAASVVKAPVEAVVAPTVPLMLMEAVPVRFVTTPDAGVPKAGVTKVGLLANTKAPVPVSSVTAAARLADDGVAKKVATPEPKPEMPVATGRPVALVNVAEDGVPNAGVTSVGEVARTLLPVPVLVTLTRPLLASVATALEAVSEDNTGCAVNVATPVTASVPPTEALPAKNKSLNFNEPEPMSTVLVVFGVTAAAPTTTSCVGPNTRMGAPSPVVPSWL